MSKSIIPDIENINNLIYIILEGTVADFGEALVHLQEIAAEGTRLGNSPDQPLFSGNTGNGAELDYLNALTSSAREF